MGEQIRNLYRSVSDTLDVDLSRLGFKRRGQEEWFRTRDGVLHRLAISLRQPAGEDTGYLEAFPGFNFPEVEDLAASLQSKKPRPGFLTCSLNIGLLTPKEVILDWPLRPNSNEVQTAQVISQTVSEMAPPFWDEFSSVADLLAHFEAKDFRLCRGAEWFWRQIAACCLVGQIERAVELLNQKLADSPPAARAGISSALDRVEKYAKG